MTTRKMDFLKYAVSIIAIFTFAAGIISGYSTLNSRVDNLEQTKVDTSTIVAIRGDVAAIREQVGIIKEILQGRYDRR